MSQLDNPALDARRNDAKTTEGSCSSRLSVLADSRIAFVILTWNSESYIEACLRSVLSLQARELLVLVFDNGSTDGTVGMLHRLAEEYPALVWTRAADNLGTTKSRNTLLRVVPADFDYVCVLDSDTVANQHAFELMTGALAANPTVGVVGPSMRNSGGDFQLSARKLPTVATKLGKVCPIPSVRRAAEASEVIDATPEEDGLVDVGYLLSACWVIPKHVLDDVGLLDEEIFYAPEDVDWCLRAHRCGYRVCQLPRAEIIHEYQRISRKKLISKSNIEHVKGLVHYYRKHRYLFDASKAM